MLADFTPYALWALTNVVTVIVWGLRLEGKVKVNEQVVIDLKELINTRFDALEKRIDKLNGKH